MVYEMIGEYPAQSFFGVNNVTGQIRVIQDLRSDGLNTNQYKVNSHLVKRSEEMTFLFIF
jgi:hypothetical protein